MTITIKSNFDSIKANAAQTRIVRIAFDRDYKLEIESNELIFETENKEFFGEAKKILKEFGQIEVS